jgi:hypothetical protein
VDQECACNRFQGWDQVVRKLALPDSNWANEAPVLRLAGQLLSRYSDATVLLDTPTDATGTPSATAGPQRINSDVLLTSPTLKEAYQVKTVARRGIEGNLNDAVDQLNGMKKGAPASPGQGNVIERAPDGYQKIAQIYPAPGSLDDTDPAATIARLKQNPNNLRFRTDPTLQLDKLVIVNSTGRHEWTERLGQPRLLRLERRLPGRPRPGRPAGLAAGRAGGRRGDRGVPGRGRRRARLPPGPGRLPRRPPGPLPRPAVLRAGPARPVPHQHAAHLGRRGRRAGRAPGHRDR